MLKIGKLILLVGLALLVKTNWEEHQADKRIGFKAEEARGRSIWSLIRQKETKKIEQVVKTEQVTKTEKKVSKTKKVRTKSDKLFDCYLEAWPMEEREGEWMQKNEIALQRCKKRNGLKYTNLWIKDKQQHL